MGEGLQCPAGQGGGGIRLLPRIVCCNPKMAHLLCPICRPTVSFRTCTKYPWMMSLPIAGRQAASTAHSFLEPHALSVRCNPQR